MSYKTKSCLLDNDKRNSISLQVYIAKIWSYVRGREDAVMTTKLYLL